MNGCLLRVPYCITAASVIEHTGLKPGSGRLQPPDVDETPPWTSILLLDFQAGIHVADLHWVGEPKKFDLLWPEVLLGADNIFFLCFWPRLKTSFLSSIGTFPSPLPL